MLNLLALPTLLLFHTLPRCLLRWHRRRRFRGAAVEAAAPQHRADDSAHDASKSTGGEENSKQTAVDCEEDEGVPPPAASLGAPPAPGGPAPASGPSLPGLARLRGRHPAAHRAAVLLVLASCYEAAILGQNVAPGLVDPAVGE